MNYPEEMCKPMREDLTSVGFVEMRTSEEVEEILNKNKLLEEFSKQIRLSYYAGPDKG